VSTVSTTKWSELGIIDHLETGWVVKPIIFKYKNIGFWNSCANLNSTGQVIRNDSSKRQNKCGWIFVGLGCRGKKINQFAPTKEPPAYCSRYSFNP
jgi:hypothetical protein